jgi:hypothetical protein
MPNRTKHILLVSVCTSVCRRSGTDVGEILEFSQRVAHAQSQRQATACKLLPPVGILLLAAKKGPNILFCMPNRTKCILLVSVMVLAARRTLAEPAPSVGLQAARAGGRSCKWLPKRDQMSYVACHIGARCILVVSVMPSDGWTFVQAEGCIDGPIDRQMDGQSDGRMDSSVHMQPAACMNEKVDR